MELNIALLECPEPSKCLLRSLNNTLVHGGLMWNVLILQLRAEQKTEVAKLLSIHNSNGLKKVLINL
jgi:hypothetical protein